MARNAMVVALALVLGAVGCRSTQLVTSWADPEASPLALDKVLVVAETGDEATRRLAENQLAGALDAAQAIPSYRVVKPGELHDLEALRARLAQEGFDGLVVMRVVGVDYVPRYTPSSTYFLDYWGYMTPYQPTDVDQHVKVETTVFSLEDDRLIWAGLTRSVDPSSVETVAARIAELVSADMRRKGLLE